MKKILEFHGNGSVVEVEGIKRQAREAPSTKLQAPSFKHQARKAPSAKPQASSTRSVRQFVALTQDLVVRHYATLTQEPRTTVHFSSLKIF